MRELLRLEEYELLEHYFDTQLAATGDYYDASRILYLLSQARINQMVLKREDLEYGLFENQFSRDGHRRVNDVIECLEDLQLIRKNIRRSDQEYEIAHDFIAQCIFELQFIESGPECQERPGSFYGGDDGYQPSGLYGGETPVQ